MNNDLKRAVTEHLSECVLESRLETIDSVIADRTRYVTVVLEDIHKPHNASAVIRSCECLGVQDVHVIENHNVYETKEIVTQGSSDWIDLHRYNRSDAANTEACFAALRSSGYRIVATTLDNSDCRLQDLPLDSKLAIVFGDEEAGLTKFAINNADIRMTIPMYGFTQSFNLSVSAAITLHQVIQRLRESEIDWHLTEDELLDLRYRWIKQSVNRSDAIERRFLQEHHHE